MKIFSSKWGGYFPVKPWGREPWCLWRGSWCSGNRWAIPLCRTRKGLES